MRRHRIALQGSRLLPGASLALPVVDSPDWRDRCDVVIIGAGIVGTCAALYLAEHGVDVVLIDKGVVAGEASGRALGFVDSVMMAREKQQAIRQSKHLWADLDRRCNGATGYRQTGLVFLYKNQRDLDRAGDWVRQMGADTDARILPAAEATALMPGLAEPAAYAGALYAPSDGTADPRRAAPAILELALRHGARLFQYCAARRICLDAGKVRGVETERGLIRCDHVIIAAGIWSSLLARPLGIEAPQLYGFATASELHGAPLPAGCGGGVEGLSFRSTLDGTHVSGPHLSLAPITPASIRQAWRFRHVLRGLGRVIDLAPNLDHFRMMYGAERWQGSGSSPFEQCRILDPEPRRYSQTTTLDRIAAAFPDGAGTRLLRSWAGALSTTPDNMPIIGPVPHLTGLYLACGMYYGLTFGPIAAAMIAADILGNEAPIDPAPFRPSRFATGATQRFYA